MKSLLTEKGLRVLTGGRSTSVTREGDTFKVSLDDGETLEGDLLIAAAGVKPRDQIARDAGLLCGGRGGIVVDAHLMTSVDDVYAIGDCALFDGQASGLVAPGYAMADRLAENLTSGRKPQGFVNPSVATRLKVSGVDVTVLGQPGQDGAERYSYKDDREYRNLYIQEGVVVGAMSVGPWAEADKGGRYISEGWELTQDETAAFAETGVLSGQADEGSDGPNQWPDATVVCQCTGTNCGQVRQAIAGGCGDLVSIGTNTTAGTVCGSCQPILSTMLGAPETSQGRWSAPALVAISLVALVGALPFLLLPPVALANTVDGPFYETLWRDFFLRQVSGFSLLGLCVLGALVSVRKRLLPKFISPAKIGRAGSMHWWRFVHVLLAVWLSDIVGTHRTVDRSRTVTVAVCRLYGRHAGWGRGLSGCRLAATGCRRFTAGFSGAVVSHHGLCTLARAGRVPCAVGLLLLGRVTLREIHSSHIWSSSWSVGPGGRVGITVFLR